MTLRAPAAQSTPTTSVPAWFGLLAAKVLGSVAGDVMLTRDEIAGLPRTAWLWMCRLAAPVA